MPNSITITTRSPSVVHPIIAVSGVHEHDIRHTQAAWPDSPSGLAQRWWRQRRRRRRLWRHDHDRRAWLLHDNNDCSVPPTLVPTSSSLVMSFVYVSPIKSALFIWYADEHVHFPATADKVLIGNHTTHRLLYQSRHTHSASVNWI